MSKARRIRKSKKALELLVGFDGRHQSEACELLRRFGYYWDAKSKKWVVKPLPL